MSYLCGACAFTTMYSGILFCCRERDTWYLPLNPPKLLRCFPHSYKRITLHRFHIQACVQQHLLWCMLCAFPLTGAACSPIILKFTVSCFHSHLSPFLTWRSEACPCCPYCHVATTCCNEIDIYWALKPASQKCLLFLRSPPTFLSERRTLRWWSGQ